MMDGMSLPADNRRGPNCGVTAIAIVAEISMTLATFVKRCAKPGRRYLVTTSGHAQVVQNGHVADQTGSHPIALYWGRNKRVTHLVEVMP
jgi:hypothetical protein